MIDYLKKYEVMNLSRENRGENNTATKLINLWFINSLAERGCIFINLEVLICWLIRVLIMVDLGVLICWLIMEYGGCWRMLLKKRWMLGRIMVVVVVFVDGLLCF